MKELLRSLNEGRREDKKYINYTRKQGSPLEKSEIEEVNVTTNLVGGEGPIRSPKIFRKKGTKKKKEENSQNVEMSTVLQTTVHTGKLQEDVLDEIEGILNEVSYRDYKRDSSSTNKTKFNTSLKEIHQSLHRIERVVDQNIKLKAEFNLKDPFWSVSRRRLGKISEKMTRISNRLRELSK